MNHVLVVNVTTAEAHCGNCGAFFTSEEAFNAGPSVTGLKGIPGCPGERPIIGSPDHCVHGVRAGGVCGHCGFVRRLKANGAPEPRPCLHLRWNHATNSCKICGIGAQELAARGGTPGGEQNKACICLFGRARNCRAKHPGEGE